MEMPRNGSSRHPGALGRPCKNRTNSYFERSPSGSAIASSSGSGPYRYSTLVAAARWLPKRSVKTGHKPVAVRPGSRSSRDANTPSGSRPQTPSGPTNPRRGGNGRSSRLRRTGDRSALRAVYQVLHEATLALGTENERAAEADADHLRDHVHLRHAACSPSPAASASAATSASSSRSRPGAARPRCSSVEREAWSTRTGAERHRRAPDRTH